MPIGAGSRGLIRELQQAMNEALDQLCDLPDEALQQACSHPCGNGPVPSTSLWHLLANDFDHERIHGGQILNARHDLRLMQTPVERFLADWLQARATLIGTLVGLSDEQLDLRLHDGQWSVREIVEHVLFWQRDSVTACIQDVAGAPA